jgi:hypothetical protein
MDIQHSPASALHVLEHAATVTLGFALIIFGLGMTFSIVFVLPGIVTLAIGFSLVVGGLFAHALRGTRPR